MSGSLGGLCGRGRDRDEDGGVECHRCCAIVIGRRDGRRHWSGRSGCRTISRLVESAPYASTSITHIIAGSGQIRAGYSSLIDANILGFVSRIADTTGGGRRCSKYGRRRNGHLRRYWRPGGSRVSGRVIILSRAIILAVVVAVISIITAHCGGRRCSRCGGRSCSD